MFSVFTGGGYGQVSQNAGKGAVQYHSHHFDGPLRPPERVEQLFKLLNLIVGVACVVVPFIALVNYPVGVLLEPMMFVMKMYVVSFGIIILLLEVNNGGSRYIFEAQVNLRRAVGLLTRIGGRGLFLIFVGCSCFNVLNPDVQDGILQALIIIVGLATCGVGVILFAFGIKASMNVDKMRRAVQNHRHMGEPVMPPVLADSREAGLLEKLTQQESFNKYITTFAQVYPDEALSKTEFQQMCQDVMGDTRFRFSDWELEMIFEALGVDQPPINVLEVQNLGNGIPTTEFVTFQVVFDWLLPGPGMLL